jgi:hypothetical protein
MIWEVSNSDLAKYLFWRFYLGVIFFNFNWSRSNFQLFHHLAFDLGLSKGSIVTVCDGKLQVYIILTYENCNLHMHNHMYKHTFQSLEHNLLEREGVSNLHPPKSINSHLDPGNRYHFDPTELILPCLDCRILQIGGQRRRQQ